MRLYIWKFHLFCQIHTVMTENFCIVSCFIHIQRFGIFIINFVVVWPSVPRTPARVQAHVHLPGTAPSAATQRDAPVLPDAHLPLHLYKVWAEWHGIRRLPLLLLQHQSQMQNSRQTLLPNHTWKIEIQKLNTRKQCWRPPGAKQKPTSKAEVAFA